MKRILFLVLLFVVATAVKAQYPVTQFLGSDSAMVKSRGGLQGRFAPIPFTDTTSANLSRISQYPGALIYTSGVDKYWYRNATSTGWIEFTSSGGSTVNIYNSNGVLTGDRNLDGTGFSLGFHTLSKFWTQSDTVDIELLSSGNKIFNIHNLTETQDTATYKPMVIDPVTGRVLQSSYWYGGSGGSGADSSVFATLYRVDTAKNNMTLQRVVNNGRQADSIFIDNGASGEQYAIRSRNVGLSFPVPTIKPTTANKNIAFDIMPTGTPGDYSDNGISWIDVCDADVSAGSGNVGTARVGITSVAVQFGSRAFGTTAKPVHFIVNADTRMELNTNNTATFNIGKVTQSQSVSGDYVGYTLLNTNNSVAESNPIFFLGNDFASNRFSYFRWNNGATSSGFRENNQLEIMSNIAGTGGVAIGALGGTSKIKFIGVGQLEMARFENYKFGILESSPDSSLTVGFGAYFKRGVRMSSIPSGGVSADSVLVIASDGSVKKRNAADFGGGGGSGTVTSVSTGYGLSGGTITTTGTILVDSASLSNYYLRRKDSLTASNLLGYVTRTVLADSAAAIRASIGSGGVADGYVDGATFSTSTNTLTLTQTGAADVTVRIPPSYLQNPIDQDSLIKEVNDSVGRIKAVKVVSDHPEILVTTTRNDSINTHTLSKIYISEPIATFSAGAGFVADTALFTDSTLYGSFFTDQDSFYITRVIVVMKGQAGDSLGIQIVHNDSINVTGTVIDGGTLAVNSLTTGNAFSVSTNQGIPPNSWVWVKSPTVIAGKRPEYLSITLVGYKKWIAP